MDNFETFQQMFEKIQVSNLNEVVVVYSENKSLRVVCIDSNKYILSYEDITFHSLSIDQAKELSCFLKDREIKEMKLEGFVVLDNIYGYPELFSVKVI